jgi:hypothetical protein
MKTVRAGLSAMAVTLLAASGLHAQEAATAPAAAPNQDVRCFMIGTALLKSNDPAAKAAAPVLMLYYLGRIDALTPKLDLVQAIKDQTPGVTADLANTAKACGDAFNARTKTLSQMGGPTPGAAESPAP